MKCRWFENCFNSDYINALTYCAEIKILNVLTNFTRIHNYSPYILQEDAYESCHVGGGVTTVIGVAPTEQRISVNPMFLLLGRTLKGTYFGGKFIIIY